MAELEKEAKKSKISLRARIQALELHQILGWAFGLFMALMVIGIIFGRSLYPFLNAIGFGWLYHAESGVYADCTKPENRSNAYCMPKTNEDRGWRGLKDSKGNPSGFSLH